MRINKFLIIFLTVFTLLTSFVLADVSVEYNLYEASINTNGEISYTTNPVDNVRVIGYECLDTACSAVGNKLWDLNSGNSDTVIINYPTNLPASGYYALYFYKDNEYIPWEIKAFWHGSTSTVQTSEAYLSRKQSCRAPIDHFSVLNDVQPNIPLVIGVEARLDAATYAAIHAAGPVEYVPSELRDIYSVKTKVRLKIYDKKPNNLVKETYKIVDMPYSDSARVEFSWTPTEAGDYTAVVSTVIMDDDKCSSQIEQSESKEFHVLEQDPRGNCYTLLNDLAVSDQFPSAGETITISANKISNYADDNGALTPVETNAVIVITDSNGNLVYQDSKKIQENDNAKDEQVFSFDWTVPSEGNYNIIVNAVGNDEICSALDNLAETERLTIYADQGVIGAPSINGIPDLTFEEGEFPKDNLIDLWNYASDSDTADANLRFRIVSQSNENLIRCSIDSNRYVDFSMPNGHGSSDITVEVSDGEYTDRDSFRIRVNRIANAPIISNIPNIDLPIRGEVELELDNYVYDPDNRKEDLIWSFVADDLDVEIKNRVATIRAPRNTFGEEIVIFTVIDPDGLSDSDGCLVRIIPRKPETDDLAVDSIKINNDYFSPGETLRMNINLKNYADVDFEEISISAVIADLGLMNIDGPFDLDRDDEINREIVLEIPEDTAPGMYDIRLSISNDKVRRVVYRDVVIV